MPGKDGTGPMGQGPMSGGRGRIGGSMAAGLGGYCKCPKCGEQVPHQQATPCSLAACPKCGAKMVRGQ